MQMYCQFWQLFTAGIILLGIFSAYLVEKEFRKLRQGSSGTYCKTVQQKIEKVNISKAPFLLSNDTNVDSVNIESVYLSLNCSFLLGRAYSSHWVYGCVFGAHRSRKRTFCLLATPKQMPFLTISKENILFKTHCIRLGAIVAPNKGLE